MAQHVDLILVFLDPIGQATCRRTMQVVERLNNSEHLEKLQYFMSKADAVEKVRTVRTGGGPRGADSLCMHCNTAAREPKLVLRRRVFCRRRCTQ